MYQVEYGKYPDSLNANCPVGPADNNYCLKPSGANTFTYASNNSSNPQTFTLDATNGLIKYRIINDSAPVAVTTTGTLADTDPANWIVIGTQVWGKYNLDVGNRINGTENPINNGLGANIEKYCYLDLDSNCTDNHNGGLYQWNEAMNYVTTEGAQGICPTNSHIPTDAEWKTLEMYLGMSQAQADATGWRGTDQGTQLKTGGLSALNVPLAGNNYTADVTFYGLSTAAYLWSSSESGGGAGHRNLHFGSATVSRNTGSDKGYGFSVRCLGN